MPIYEYSCPDCGHRFDVLQKFSDDPVRDCPSCKAQNVKKLISATSFVLKGGGWYKDHYGLKSGASSESASGSASTPSSSAASTSTSSGDSGAASSAPAASTPAPSPTPPAAK